MEEHLRDLSLSSSGREAARSGGPPGSSRMHDDSPPHPLPGRGMVEDHHSGKEAEVMKESMQQDALLRSRLLSSRHSFTQGGLGGEDVVHALNLDGVPTLVGGGLAGAGAGAAGGLGGHLADVVDGPRSLPSMGVADRRARSISFSASMGPQPNALPTLATGDRPAERYSTIDLFPENPEQFLPEVQDFQRVIILSTPEPLDGDTQIACRQLRKAMKLRSKWLGVPVDPEAPGGVPSPAVDTPQYPESPTHYGSGGGGGGGGAPACTPLAPHQQPAPDSPRTSAYNRMKGRQAPPYEPFAYDPPPASRHTVKLVDGVYQVWDEAGEALSEVLGVEEFYDDFHELTHLMSSGPVKTYAYKRLQVLEARFHLHKLLNSDRELAAQKSVPHRDFYNIRKVDTHVHHSACMHLKHLLRFIKHKLKTGGGEIVAFRDGQFLTLKEVFQSLKITAMDLSVDTLDMHANNTFHRFDRFNLKYNPAGQSRLREIFLKTDNLIAGTYMAVVTQQVISDLDASKYQLVEWRVSIYGRKPSEWDKLARWFYTHRLASEKVRWLIQIPRLYAVYKASGEIDDFEHILRNVFAPLFEATRDPQSNPPLATFLNTIVGFDCVDDESKPEIHANQGQTFPPPKDWTYKQEPPYSYWCYYVAANIKSLNDFRRARGMSTFEFRPHCGEAGDPEHLTAAYLLADKINHGIVLRKVPGLQLLYYLSQVGIAMSPLSNNKLFLDYHRNPFVKYFYQGLNVSLSTDDPLMLHYTKDPLVEEYSVAAQVWRLSATDLCEMARNSVLQSGFEDVFKRHFLGKHYDLPGAAGNDIRQTNVPDVRVRYRHEVWRNEREAVERGGGGEEGAPSRFTLG